MVFKENQLTSGHISLGIHTALQVLLLIFVAYDVLNKL